MTEPFDFQTADIQPVCDAVHEAARVLWQARHFDSLLEGREAARTLRDAGLLRDDVGSELIEPRECPVCGSHQGVDRKRCERCWKCNAVLAAGGEVAA